LIAAAIWPGRLPGSFVIAMSSVSASHPYRLLVALAAAAVVLLVVLLLIADERSSPVNESATVTTQAPETTASPHGATAAMGAGQAGSVDTLVERLRTRLQAESGDVDGWVLLGRSYHFLQRWEEATAAFAKARALGWQGEAPALDGSNTPASIPSAPDPVFQGVQDAVQRDAEALKARP
jgi:cytochrome c-type biogenesis protein CcmH